MSPADMPGDQRRPGHVLALHGEHAGWPLTARAHQPQLVRLACGSAGSPCAMKTAMCSCRDVTTIAIPPLLTGAVRITASGALSTAATVRAASCGSQARHVRVVRADPDRGGGDDGGSCR